MQMKLATNGTISLLPIQQDCSFATTFHRVIKNAKKLVAKFNKSPKATERLIALAHKTPL